MSTAKPEKPSSKGARGARSGNRNSAGSRRHWWDDWHKPVVAIIGGVAAIAVSADLLVRQIPSFRADFCKGLSWFCPLSPSAEGATPMPPSLNQSALPSFTTSSQGSATHSGAAPEQQTGRQAVTASPKQPDTSINQPPSSPSATLLGPSETSAELQGDDVNVIYRTASKLYADKRYELALPLFKKAADRNHTEAMNTIAYMFDNGLGVSKDHSTANIYYERSAALGDQPAIGELCSRYKRGFFEIQPDAAKAARWCALEK